MLLLCPQRSGWGWTSNIQLLIIQFITWLNCNNVLSPYWGLIPVSLCRYSAEEISSGQLLCGGLFSGDPVSTWLCAVALTHALKDNTDQKVGGSVLLSSHTHSRTTRTRRWVALCCRPHTRTQGQHGPEGGWLCAVALTHALKDNRDLKVRDSETFVEYHILLSRVGINGWQCIDLWNMCIRLPTKGLVNLSLLSGS